MSLRPGQTPAISALNDGESTNPSTNTHIQDIIDARLSRRGVLKGGIAASTTALFSSIGLSACGGSGNNKDDALTLNFDAVAKNKNDVVTVPAGYQVSILHALGDPLTSPTPPGPTTAARAPSPTIVVSAMATTACTTSACPMRRLQRLPL
jgi:hypothetical protein